MSIRDNRLELTILALSISGINPAAELMINLPVLEAGESEGKTYEVRELHESFNESENYIKPLFECFLEGTGFTFQRTICSRPFMGSCGASYLIKTDKGNLSLMLFNEEFLRQTPAGRSKESNFAFNILSQHLPPSILIFNREEAGLKDKICFGQSDTGRFVLQVDPSSLRS